MKRLKHICAVGALTWLTASAVSACDCVMEGWKKRVSASKVIFVGRVVQYRLLEEIRFEVEEVFKGHVSRSVRIPFSGSDCDYFVPPLKPKIGERYLIYATKEPRHLYVSRCLGSGRVEELVDELILLRNRHRQRR